MIDRHSVAIITALLATQLSAQCVQPQRPPPLDARTQSVDQFQANYQTAETYLAEADAFLRCIEYTERTLAETGAGDDSYDSDSKATRRRAFHATVDGIRAVSDNMKKQSEAFAKRNDAPVAAAPTAAPSPSSAPDSPTSPSGTGPDAATPSARPDTAAGTLEQAP